MPFDPRRETVRERLEAAVRLQRESWDEALAVEEIAGDSNGGDLYALVAELAGGLEDEGWIQLQIRLLCRSARTPRSGAEGNLTPLFRRMDMNSKLEAPKMSRGT